MNEILTHIKNVRDIERQNTRIKHSVWEGNCEAVSKSYVVKQANIKRCVNSSLTEYTTKARDRDCEIHCIQTSLWIFNDDVSAVFLTSDQCLCVSVDYNICYNVKHHFDVYIVFLHNNFFVSCFENVHYQLFILHIVGF